MIILPILTTSLIHFGLEGWENVLFELGSERVETQPTQERILTSLPAILKVILTLSEPGQKLNKMVHVSAKMSTFKSLLDHDIGSITPTQREFRSKLFLVALEGERGGPSVESSHIWNDIRVFLRFMPI